MSDFGQEYEGLNDSQKAAAMTRRIDELEKQNNAADDAIRNAKLELSELPGAAMDERRSKKDYIRGLQRAINANEIEIGMLKEEYTTLGLQTIDASYEAKRFNNRLYMKFTVPVNCISEAEKTDYIKRGKTTHYSAPEATTT